MATRLRASGPPMPHLPPWSVPDLAPLPGWPATPASQGKVVPVGQSTFLNGRPPVAAAPSCGNLARLSSPSHPATPCALKAHGQGGGRAGAKLEPNVGTAARTTSRSFRRSSSRLARRSPLAYLRAGPSLATAARTTSRSARRSSLASSRARPLLAMAVRGRPHDRLGDPRWHARELGRSCQWL